MKSGFPRAAETESSNSWMESWFLTQFVSQAQSSNRDRFCLTAMEDSGSEPKGKASFT